MCMVMNLRGLDRMAAQRYRLNLEGYLRPLEEYRVETFDVS